MPVIAWVVVTGVLKFFLWLLRSASLRKLWTNRSPVEAVPCTTWELRALTGAAEGLSRASLVAGVCWACGSAAQALFAQRYAAGSTAEADPSQARSAQRLTLTPFRSIMY
jgi:hypothetical protein